MKTPDELEEILESNSFQHLFIFIQHGFLAGALSRHHDASFGRMLIAPGPTEQLTIITHDVRTEPYEVAILWS